MSEIAVSVENISKIYRLYNDPKDRLKEALHPFRKKYHNDFYALDDVTFEIKRGETIGVIGKNGSGKSTLLKIITRVLQPSSGNIIVNGKVSALLELGSGFNPELTGLENAYFNGVVMGFTKEEMDSKIEEIVSFADIGDFLYQPVKTYSSGMYARLAFACAINVDPDILIVDESLSVGDMAFQSKCFNKFREFQNANKTILFVTHSIDLIVKYCQTAILLNNGCLVAQGDVKDTTEKYRRILAGISIDNMSESYEEIYSDCLLDHSFKTNLPLNKNANIYGNYKAEIIDYAIINSENQITNQIRHNEDYKILITVIFNEDIFDPIFAFTIKSVDGLELTGTNTKYLENSFGYVKKKELITVEFSQKMILNSGSYFLALGCTSVNIDQIIVFHRIYDAFVVEVISSEMASGIAYSKSEVKIKRLGS